MGKAARVKRTMRRYLAHKAEKYQSKLQNGGVLAEAAVASQKSASPPTKPAPWVWPEAPADKRDLLSNFDRYTALRNGLSWVAERDSEWAGIPMPLDGQRLIIEPKYPRAKELMAIGQAKTEAEDEAENAADGVPRKIRNRFWSWSRRCEVIVWEEGKSKKITWGVVPEVHGLPYALETLRSSDAWSIEGESRALQTLATLIRHRQFKQYLLTGAFLETSKRSGVTYLFRKLRPTVAIRADQRTNETRVLCALCLHPISYYAGSWAGSMVPTDDVLAHLMLMRGDERLFWARANQHEAFRAAAGL